jgi:hypothetical protein
MGPTVLLPLKHKHLYKFAKSSTLSINSHKMLTLVHQNRYTHHLYVEDAGN